MTRHLPKSAPHTPPSSYNGGELAKEQGGYGAEGGTTDALATLTEEGMT